MITREVCLLYAQPKWEITISFLCKLGNWSSYPKYIIYGVSAHNSSSSNIFMM